MMECTGDIVPARKRHCKVQYNVIRMLPHERELYMWSEYREVLGSSLSDDNRKDMAVVAASGQVAPAVLHALPQAWPGHPEQATCHVRFLFDTLKRSSRTGTHGISPGAGGSYTCRRQTEHALADDLSQSTRHSSERGRGVRRHRIAG